MIIIIAKFKNNKYVKKKNKFLDILKLVGVGTIAGFINGFFGAGGGLLLVPMIKFAEKEDSKVAHATTLVCVLCMCAVSSVLYIVKSQVDYYIFLFCAIGSVAGSLIGTKLLKKLKNKIIDLVFSLVLIVAGVLMIVV